MSEDAETLAAIITALNTYETTRAARTASNLAEWASANPEHAAHFARLAKTYG
jgi:hypothetical protein